MNISVKLSVLYMGPCVQLFFQDLEKFSIAAGVRASCYPPRAARRRGQQYRYHPVLVGKIAATELHLQLNRA